MTKQMGNETKHENNTHLQLSLQNVQTEGRGVS